MGVPEDAPGDASHYSPPQGAETPAAQDYQASSQLLGVAHNLRVRTADGGVDSCNLSTHLPEPLNLSFEVRVDLFTGETADLVPVSGIYNHRLTVGEWAGQGYDLDHVQLRAEVSRELNRHPRGPV